MATETYRNEKLEEATKKLEEAREAKKNSLTRKERMEAYEEIEFWGNKVAYLHGSKI